MQDIATSRLWITKWFPTDIARPVPVVADSPQANAVMGPSGSPYDHEQVMLNPAIFREMRYSLRSKPSADMFASDSHHKLPRYYSKDPADVASAGVDAFPFD